MRITEIHLTGHAGNFAVARRKTGGEFIEVEIITPAGNHAHHVQPDDAADIWSMAEILYEALEGAPGRRSQIREYDTALRQLSAL